MKHKIALLIALIVGYCVFVFALASTLLAQPMRYEYRATPIENGPITVPCFVVDRFNFLCIETGDIFVNVASDDAFQQWIHDNRPACCDHRDCKPARVEWTPNGWRVEGADNLINEKQVIAWPFAVPYACIINRYARCLFLNSGG